MRLRTLHVVTAIVATASIMALSSCSSGSSGNAPTASTDAAPPLTDDPAEQSADDSESSSFAPQFRTWTIQGVTREDVSVTATVDLDSTIYPAAAAMDDASFGPLLNACASIDPQRDAVMVASVQLTADNNGFETPVGVGVSFVDVQGASAPPVSLQLEKWAPTSVEFAVGYSEPACWSTYQNQLAFGVDASVAPDPNGGSTSSWGPVPVAFILHGFYGPSHPDSNKKLKSYLSGVTFLIASTATLNQNGPLTIYDIPRAKGASGPGKKNGVLGRYFVF